MLFFLFLYLRMSSACVLERWFLGTGRIYSLGVPWTNSLNMYTRVTLASG